MYVRQYQQYLKFEGERSIDQVCIQGIIQDFEVEGGNEKSNQKMLLKKGQLLFQYPAMDTQS